MPPLTRLCHVCGRQYGLSSFDIHLKQCKKLWIAQEEKKPPHERRETPKTPPGLEESVQKHGKATKNAIDALNRAAAEQFNQTVSAQSEFTMEKCPNCGRTFAEGRLEIHSRSCRPDSVAKRVEDGAAPRNKKVLSREYGRVNKTHDSDDNSPPSTTTATSPYKQPKTRSVSAEQNYDASEFVRPPTTTSRLEQSGGNSLAGSLASNRKKVEFQQRERSGSANRQNLVSPLAPSGAEISTVDLDLAKAFQGHEDVVRIVEAKLDRWEAVTLTTLQEIRDLKKVFSMIKKKK